jgi:Domain of unknown function (DUF4400)
VTTFKHVAFWFAIFVAGIFLLPLYVSSGKLQVFVANEVQLTRDVLGARAARFLSERAEIAFHIIDSAADEFKFTDKEVKQAKTIGAQQGEAVALAGNYYFTNLGFILFLVIYRILIFAMWCLLLCPIFVAAVIDGWASRAIKFHEMGAIRPSAFAAAAHVTVLFAVAPFIFSLLPLHINPLVTPLWAGLMAVPLAAMVSNMQPIFGRL